LIALRLLRWGVRLVPHSLLRAELACGFDRWLEQVLKVTDDKQVHDRVLL
jgi:hypothetical protein